MMKFKKFLAAAMTGAMMLGMVTTATPAVSTYAGTSTKLETSDTMIFHAAATQTEVPTGSSIYEKMEITVISKNDPFVIVKVYKDADKKDKVTGTYTYPTDAAGKVTIDLGGFYKPGKKQVYIECYGSSNTEVPLEGYTFTLGKAADKLKIKVDKTATDCKTALKIENFAEYSYRSLYGTEWQSLQVFADNYDTARVAGTTIVVRKNATQDTPASAEVKVKINGMAKAPTLKITYEKDQIKVKGMQLAVIDGTGGYKAVRESAYKDQSQDMKFEDLVKFAKDAGMSDEQLAKPFSIIVRTNKSNKISMPSIYTLTPPPVLTSESQTISGASIKCLATTSGSSITVAGTEKKNKTEVTFTVKNDGEIKYEYEYSLDGKNGWKKVPTKPVSITGDKIFVRVAGQKAPKKDTDPAPRFPSNGVELTIPVSKAE